MFCHTKPNVTQTNFYKLHPKLHPYQDEVDQALPGSATGSDGNGRGQVLQCFYLEPGRSGKTDGLTGRPVGALGGLRRRG